MHTSVRPAGGVRNPIGFRQRIRRLQGSAVQLDLRTFDEDLAAIVELEGSIRALSDADLRDRWHGIRREVARRPRFPRGSNAGVRPGS